MSQPITPMNTSRAYWTCQLLGWGLYGSSQAYNGIVTLPVPWERVVVEITLLNLTAVGFTQLLRVFMLRRGWTKLSMRQLLPRSLVTSVLLGFVLGSAMHFMAVAPLWSLAPIQDQGTLEAIPSPFVALDPLARSGRVNWSLVFFIWIGAVHQHHVGTRAACGRAAPVGAEPGAAVRRAEAAQVAAQSAFPVQLAQQRACAHR